MIQDREGIPPAQQRLFFSGSELADSRRTLKDLGITPASFPPCIKYFSGSTLTSYPGAIMHLVLRLSRP